MICQDCGTPVELMVLRDAAERRRRPPYLVDADGSGMRRHFCPPPSLDAETSDLCGCGQRYVRINGGDRLNLDRVTPHACPRAPTAPPASPPRGPNPNGGSGLAAPPPPRETKFL